MDEVVLERLERGPGIFVAEVDGRLAGFAMTSEPAQASHNGPAVKCPGIMAEKSPDQRLFLYGPTAVSLDYQGRGILRRLLTELSVHLEADFDLGVAFVDEVNHKSMAVHQHFGMTAFPSLDSAGAPIRRLSLVPSFLCNATSRNT